MQRDGAAQLHGGGGGAHDVPVRLVGPAAPRQLVQEHRCAQHLSIALVGAPVRAGSRMPKARVSAPRTAEKTLAEQVA